MRADPRHRWAPFRARQTIAVDRIGFNWRATTGPLGCIAITDALDATGPKLSVIALGVIPLARAVGDAALTKGELQRYLAELPLAPDAILRNLALDWEVLNSDVLRVSATHCGVHTHVDLALGADGLVTSVFAPDRPRAEGGASVEHPWKGRFSDYRRRAGRLVPFAAEVGWVLDGEEHVYWRGRMTSWNLGGRA
ncbi:hypothetical protein BH10PSE3_BH10PSE3_26980 [soil metagenome]